MYLLMGFLMVSAGHRKTVELRLLPPVCVQLDCDSWLAIGAPMPGGNSIPEFGSTADASDDVNDDKTVCFLGTGCVS